MSIPPTNNGFTGLSRAHASRFIHPVPWRMTELTSLQNYKLSNLLPSLHRSKPVPFLHYWGLKKTFST